VNNEFKNPPFLDNLIPIKTDLTQQQTADWTPRPPVHKDLGCRFHADTMIPVADGIALAADIATPRVEGRYPAVVAFRESR
jgi:predicted acyl esterase